MNGTLCDGLRFDRLEVRLDGTLLAALDTTVMPGEALVVMGPSGSGKSSLLGAITGHLGMAGREAVGGRTSGKGRFAVTGAIALNGRDVGALPPEARRIGLLFQDDVLFPHLSVAGNLGFGLAAGSGSRAQRRRTIEEALERADLAGFADRDPATLSGGQRARVALLRCLLARPEALLLDEPFSRLDMDLRDQIRRFVLEEARARRLPVILVTHDPEDALAAGGRVVTPLGEPQTDGGAPAERASLPRQA